MLVPGNHFFEQWKGEGPTLLDFSVLNIKAALGTDDDPFAWVNYEMSLQVNPKTKQLPEDIYRKERQFARTLPKRSTYFGRANLRPNTADWVSVGPGNIGGRTRALAVDILDENVMIAGGVSGGMWRSEDGGESWNRSSHPATINSATEVVQDIRSGKENIWYHTTGELLGNSARGPGAPYRGDGIFKSIDGGRTWFQLASTQTPTVTRFESQFNYQWDIVVNHQRTDIDEVFTAALGGILRSQDGGNSWEAVLGDELIDLPPGEDLNNAPYAFYTDIAISPSGIFYATISPFTTTGSLPEEHGVFRSVDGENWVNITPRTFPATYKRVETGIAPGNENVVYFFVNAEPPQLWRYQFIGGTAEDPRGFWENLTSSLGDLEGEFGELDVQGGYNMVLGVHPEDENLVLLGATNLYRSTDGFGSTSEVDWVGGYNVDNTGAVFRNHYPRSACHLLFPRESQQGLHRQRWRYSGNGKH